MTTSHLGLHLWHASTSYAFQKQRMEEAQGQEGQHRSRRDRLVPQCAVNRHQHMTQAWHDLQLPFDAKSQSPKHDSIAGDPGKCMSFQIATLSRHTMASCSYDLRSDHILSLSAETSQSRRLPRVPGCRAPRLSSAFTWGRGWDPADMLYSLPQNRKLDPPLWEMLREVFGGLQWHSEAK